VLRHFAWQGWHLATSTFVLRGRRGTYDTGLDLVARLGAISRPRLAAALCVAGVVLGDLDLRFCVAGVALGDIDLRFAWQVWHLKTLGWIWWRAWAPLVARGAVALCLAGVALGDIELRVTWHRRGA